MDKERLGRKIYITYKSRISAAERLKKTENFIQGLNIYYSLFLTALSIYSVNNSSTKLSLILTIASVIVTVAIVFLSSKRYAERAKDLKNNYILLDELYTQVANTPPTEIDKLMEFNSRYMNLLNNSENHTEYDYYSAIRSIGDEQLTSRQTRSYIVHSLFTKIIIAFLIAVPFLIRFVAKLIELVIVI